MNCLKIRKENCQPSEYLVYNKFIEPCWVVVAENEVWLSIVPSIIWLPVKLLSTITFLCLYKSYLVQMTANIQYRESNVDVHIQLDVNSPERNQKHPKQSDYMLEFFELELD